MASKQQPPVVLFGYDSSPFTNKVRLALRVKQIPFSYVAVPSMMPRPLLSETFAIDYRKIPILAIGRELYCDTSLIIEALEHYFPISAGYGTIYPKFAGVDEWTYKGLVRGFASFWTDKPLFRTTTGLIPSSVWSSPFGADRSQLIGHTLDPTKLGGKLPQHLASLDLHLSMLEPTFNRPGQWAMPTPTPSLADISLYYQLRWGIDIAAGKGIYNLTGGSTPDTNVQTTAGVFNEARYPGLWAWFHAFESYVAGLADLEKTVPESDVGWKQALMDTPFFKDEEMLVATPSEQHADLDAQRGLEVGKSVSICPDDTGRDNPTVGEMVGLGVEEVVIKPGGKAEVPCRVHFPRLGFLIRVVEGSRL